MILLDVETDVTAKTFRRASTLIAWWLIGRILAVFDLAMLVVLVLAWSAVGLTTPVVIAAEVTFGGLFLLFVIMVVAPRARRSKALNEGHMHFVANEEGYLVEGPFGTQTIRWSTYKRACVDKRFIYLFFSNRKLNLLRPTPRTWILF
jgi:hypothetical protein